MYDDCANTPAGSVVDVFGCAINTACALPEPDPVFDPDLVWTSTVPVDARETTLVGDITGDGIPNVVVDDYRDTIYVLNGQTGATEYAIEIGAGFQFERTNQQGNIVPARALAQNNSANAIADIDGDGYGEIFTPDAQQRLGAL